MKSILKILVVGSVVSVSSFSIAQAATVNIVTGDGQAQETVDGIRTTGTKTGTYGLELIGATTQVTYTDGYSEVVVWEAVPNCYGGACRAAGQIDGEGIGLYMDWRGFEMTTTRRLATLKFDFTSVKTLFDISFAGTSMPGNTPSSKNGYPFEIMAGGEGLVGNITATYSGIVNLVGSPAEGDLYTSMSVDFSNLEHGGFLGDMTFRSDLDTLGGDGDLTPVPVPMSMSFMVVGLGALGLTRRRSLKFRKIL